MRNAKEVYLKVGYQTRGLQLQFSATPRIPCTPYLLLVPTHEQQSKTDGETIRVKNQKQVKYMNTEMYQTALETKNDITAKNTV